MISVIIPTLDSAAQLQRTLAPLVPAAAEGLVRELVVSDGGSTDDTLVIVEAVGARIVEGPPGRARQLIAGAAVARSEWMLFLHPGAALDEEWSREAARFISRPAGRAAAFRFVAGREWWTQRWRSVQSPRGDQGLLISRKLYDDIGGYRDMAREDIDIARRLGRTRLTTLQSGCCAR